MEQGFRCAHGFCHGEKARVGTAFFKASGADDIWVNYSDLTVTEPWNHGRGMILFFMALPQAGER
jgi:hypothetical protein